jgi:energy-coupling factor transporter ATP-binding protein EcfA2
MNSTSDSYVLCARGLRKDHSRDASLVRAVDGVDLGVAAGETGAIMGPSGCGKSTLLYLLGGLDRPTSGEIWLAGQNLTPLSERGLARLRPRADRVRVPGLPPDGRADRGGERGAARAARRARAAHRPAAGHRAAGASRAGRPGQVPARAAVRRPCATGRSPTRQGTRTASPAARAPWPEWGAEPWARSCSWPSTA